MAQAESVSTSLAEERRRRILHMIDQNGGVTISELVDSLAVTPMTIWRDLKQLEEFGLLRRVRGGAARLNQGGASMPGFSGGPVEAMPFKKAIAAEAVRKFVTDRQTLFISGGSTAAECAAFIPKGVRVISNSLLVLNRTLGSSSVTDVQSTGGILNQESGSFHGPDARRFIRSKHADVFLFSCDGLDPKRGVTDVDTLEVEVKQEMAQFASKVVLLADSSKLEKVCAEQVLPMDAIDCLVTDFRAPTAILKALRKHFDILAVKL